MNYLAHTLHTNTEIYAVHDWLIYRKHIPVHTYSASTSPTFSIRSVFGSLRSRSALQCTNVNTYNNAHSDIYVHKFHDPILCLSMAALYQRLHLRKSMGLLNTVGGAGFWSPAVSRSSLYTYASSCALPPVSSTRRQLLVISVHSSVFSTLAFRTGSKNSSITS
jgi:hypothetical protein